MADHKNSRSGTQTAFDLARLAKALVRIAKAAAAAGLKGAAVAAVKETLPFLVKLAVGILVVLLVLPMLVFTALPNIFFGYDHSGTDSIIEMTEQAMLIGGTYMSLEDFENTQVDALVTSIVSEYESEGERIDRIEVESDFDEEDLLWFIAINSVDYRQDLAEMDVDEIRRFSSSCLSYSAEFIPADESGRDTSILRIRVNKLNPEELMDRLGFDDEARTWAGALHETLAESDALDQYAPYFEDYRPNYEGDTSYDGEVAYGGSYDNRIDISQFVDPSTKNNLDLAAYAIQAWENNWGYVWGTYGNILTKSLFQYKLEQYPEGRSEFEGCLVYSIRESNFRAGLSRVFRNLPEASFAYRQAGIALEMGLRQNPQLWKHSFDDYALSYLMQSCTRELPARFVCSPALLLLRQKDRETGSDYYHTLKAWLEHGQNTVQTAKDLFIHRGTLIYRLDKIREMTGIDLDAWQEQMYLLFSYQLLEAPVYHNYRNTQ